MIDVIPPEFQERLASLLTDWVQTYIANQDSQISALKSEIESLRKERDESVRIAGLLRDLRDAAVRWRRDAYSPRLQAAIDVFLRQEIARR